MGWRVSGGTDGILHDGLEGQRRHAEEGVRRVILNGEAFGILRLLHSEIGARVLQLRGKGDGRGACHGGEIFAQVGGEIHDHLLGLFRVLTAQAIDARHGVVDEVGPHLQHHDAGALLGDLPLLAKILLDLIGQDETVHGQGGEHHADVKEQERIDKRLYQQRDRHRQQGDEKAQIDLAGQKPPPPDHSREIEQQNRNYRQQHKRIPGPPVNLPVRCDKVKCVDDEAARGQDGIDGPQAGHCLQEPGFPHVLSAAVQQQNRHHRHRQRQQQTFQNLHEADHRARGGGCAQGNIRQDRADAQDKHEKKAAEKAPVPAIDTGHNGGEPQPQRTQQQRRADDEIIEKIVPAVHLSPPPAENG